MNTQNTPVHIHLWHHDFWRMAIANLLLAMSVYMLIPVLPAWMLGSQQLTLQQTGLAMGAFGAGLFLLGGFTSFLVQHYRRNQVCIVAILLMVASLAVLYYQNRYWPAVDAFPLILLQRVAMGAFFGLAQMILSSTLIIDTCESFQRTEANHSASWFGRFSLSLGPLFAIVIYRHWGFETVLWASAGCALTAVVLIMLVHFPFRAPADQVPVMSLDRFLLPQGSVLFANQLLIMLSVGLLLSLPLPMQFYSMLMVGFLLAILAQRFVFREAELKSEVVSGLVLMGAALLMLLTRQQAVVGYLAPLFVGFGIGIIGSRFLLFFIKLSRHCQRGTSQSTFMLAWEGGLALGLGLGYGVCLSDRPTVLIAALVLVVAALALYQFAHGWFLGHKNR